MIAVLNFPMFVGIKIYASPQARYENLLMRRDESNSTPSSSQILH